VDETGRAKREEIQSDTSEKRSSTTIFLTVVVVVIYIFFGMKSPTPQHFQPSVDLTSPNKSLIFSKKIGTIQITTALLIIKTEMI